MTGARRGDDSEVVSDNSQATPKIAPPALPENSNHTSLQITTHKLNGKNFLKWSRSVLMVVRGKGKLGYLDGKIPMPKETDPSYPEWEAQNSMVMAWLIHSMEDNIADTYILFPTAKRIWDAVTLAYSDLKNSSQVFELRNRAKNLRQGENDVTQYYNELTKLWQELDLFRVLQWKDPDDAILYRRMVEDDRVYDFLAGLNKELDDVRGRLLGLKPLPVIEEVFAEVRREESRRRVMLGTSTDPGDASALATRGPANRGDSKEYKKWCDHCEKPYHTRETCWKIHGKPTNWTPKKSRGREGKSLQVESEHEPGGVLGGGFSKDQIEQLRKMLAIPQASSTSLMAQKGTLLTAFGGLTKQGEPWIIDSGATDHMTGCEKLFSSYNPSPGNHKVRVADGSLSVVAGTGTIKISSNITLKAVLHVPNLSCNLLSISKITKDLDCVINFSASTCVFQDRTSGRRIGSAKEVDGLYHFEDDFFVRSQVQVAVGSSPLSRTERIMLLHCRLGHPSFSYLKHLFPSLFKNHDLFQCEICQLAKHNRIFLPSQPYRASKPFSLIHSDIWGPSRVCSLTNKRWFITFTDDHTRVCWVYLLKGKAEVGSVFQNFYSLIKTQYNESIKILRTDNGTEYFTTVLADFLIKNGIIHQSSCVGTPKQNGVSERKNRHLLEVARSLLFQSNVPKCFWGDAILTACYLINRMPSRVLNFQTPLNRLFESYPESRSSSMLDLKVFGCSAFVHNLDPHRSKFDPRSHKCVFLGYSTTQKGYRCYSIEKKKYFVSPDVTFFENEPFFIKKSLQGERQSEDIFKEKSQNSVPHYNPESWEYFWDPSLPQNLLKTDSIAKNTNLPISQSSDFLSPRGNPPTNLDSQQNLNLSSSSHPDILNPSSADMNSPSQNQDGSVPTPTIEEHIVAEGGKLLPYDLTYSRKKNPKGSEKPDTSQCQESEPKSGTNTNVSDLDLPIAVRKGVRSCTSHPISNFVAYDHLSSSIQALVSNLASVEVPKNIQEAWEIQNWRDAIMEEMRALEKNRTWDVVQKPKEKEPVGCKWVFTIKYKANGSIERYKARLVAKGYTQTYGVDYQETFAPVAKINTVRVLLSLAANLDWPLQQLDVKNAFLNGDLEEEVYMELPPGFDGEKKNGKVCRLRKSLYGLKQSPRAWFDRFAKAIRRQEYQQAQADHTLFYRHKNGKTTILIVYVDDIILTGDDIMEMDRLKKALTLEFEMKDLGNLRYFLGMEIARSKSGISVSQRKYVLDLLKETGMLGCKPAETPIDPNVKFDRTSNLVDRGRYQRLVGKLIYLSHTRPDIAFAVSRVSQYMHSPTEEHLEAVFRVLRYLKGTPGRGLYFKKNEGRNIEAYTDADWAGAIEDRRSTSGYCTFVWGNLVTWRSKKQTVVARSSAEAELRAVAHGICEVLWLKILLEELKAKLEFPLKIYCDNKAAINISHNPVHHDRTKHVEVDRHFIKEKIEDGTVCMTYVPTSRQAADILTKGISRPLFEKLIDKLGMFNLYSPA